MTIDQIAIRPGDAEYDAARTTYAGTAEPAVVLRPADTAGVVAALGHARSEGLEVAVRSGGHNALGFGNIDGGAVIDLGRLDSVEVLGDGRVRIGGGAKWGAAARALAEHGLALTSGDTVSVGVGGLTQAGGVGWMVRKHGLTIDSLLGAEVVTAAGEVVRADADTNPDLFWALRGGGGNFGIVTALEFQAQPMTTLHFGMLSFTLDDVPQLLKGWAATMATAPDELSSTLVLMPGFGDFPAGAMVWVAYCGDDPSAIDPLRSLGNLQADTVAEKAYADVLEEARTPEGVQPLVDNALLEHLSGDAIDAITTAYSSGTAGRVFFLRGLGGAFGRVDPEATAFAHRAAQVMVVSAKFVPIDAPEEVIAAARAEWETIGRHGIGAYAGFLGNDTPEDVATLYRPETLARLVGVKRAWDPDNVFRRNFNIRP
jgi:FAD/FMN-containing dehydrogenase